MSVTTASRSFVLAATNDTVSQRIHLTGLSLVGTGMTAGQRLTVTDNDGSIVCDHYVENANENVEFLQGRSVWLPGLKITASPAAGTWTVVANYD